MGMQSQFDVIVVGGGHAGTEAALASARVGAKTLLLTHNMDTVGQMSCNPAIGGIGKGHLVKEIDALGGVMAMATDVSGIQFRCLNASKGPAVRATRAQTDRSLYRASIRGFVDNQPNLSCFQQSVEDFVIKNGRIQAVVTQMGLTFSAKAVVLTAGTFLGGRIYVGDETYQGGRAGDAPSNKLAEKLRALPFRVARLKTGTPPRIDGKTVDFSVMGVQPGDDPLPVFSFMGNVSQHPEQVPCHITYTNEKTHQIIRDNIHRSAIFSGNIEGVAPRYCPSVEDKIMRFADKNAHQVFIEPEGLNTQELYPNGLSTSLPFDVQCDFIRSMKGCEKAHITRPGYAIEYDYFDPQDLKPSLETKFVEGLFFAGQINGTTGYEEAGAQGLIAGLNAARQTKALAPWAPTRQEAYAGVLIDDLTTLGTQEPYRMFTSRAEYRLLLREDNADLRLTEVGYAMGLVGEARWRAFNEKREAIEKETQRMKQLIVHPNTPEANALKAHIEKPLTREYHVNELLRRPELTYKKLMLIESLGPGVADPKVAEQVETQAKYQGYLDRQRVEIEKQKRHENTRIPSHFNFDSISGLSSELKEKLNRVRPETIGAAIRIQGMTPAAISLLLVFIKKGQHADVLTSVV